jgi:pyrimidine operon attenuation protein/uracil phosphoribosyltransferase
MSKTIQILNAEEMDRALERLAFEVLEQHVQSQNLGLVGIQRRGVQIAERIKSILEERLGRGIPLGKLDINLYRDDWTHLSSQPSINSTNIPFPIDDKELILLDDVLFTGRTIRAALEAILDFGRPRRVELLVLVDRGHRELPIHPDYVGKKINSSREEQVDVLVQELDGKDEVILQSKP